MDYASRLAGYAANVPAITDMAGLVIGNKIYSLGGFANYEFNEVFEFNLGIRNIAEFNNERNFNFKFENIFITISDTSDTEITASSTSAEMGYGVGAAYNVRNKKVSCIFAFSTIFVFE